MAGCTGVRQRYLGRLSLPPTLAVEVSSTKPLDLGKTEPLAARCWLGLTNGPRRAKHRHPVAQKRHGWLYRRQAKVPGPAEPSTDPRSGAELDQATRSGHNIALASTLLTGLDQRPSEGNAPPSRGSRASWLAVRASGEDTWAGTYERLAGKRSDTRRHSRTGASVSVLPGREDTRHPSRN